MHEGGKTSGGNRPASTAGQEGALISLSGILRLALAAVVVVLLVVAEAPTWPAGAYLAVGISTAFGALVAAGRPKSLRLWPPGVLLDALAVTLLVASTGGEGSLFAPLYFLVALGLVRAGRVVWGIVGAVALVLAFAVGVASPERSFEPLLSSAVAFEAGLVALFGGVAALGGASMRDARQKGKEHASALAAERRYAEKSGAVASRITPLLTALSVEERLYWVVETVREALAVPYAHATTSDGSIHRTAVRGDRAAYPSWWHPEIQSLVLWSCRTGEAMHSDAAIHGMEGFVTVPLVAESGETVGAVVAGGRRFDAGDERALWLLAVPVASALAEAGEAAGGLDPVSGVPNQDSLDRVLRRELSLGKPLTLVMVGLDYPAPRSFGLAAKNSVLRAVGQRLREASYRVFRGADSTFAVLVREVGNKKARAAALKIRRTAEEAAGPPVTIASGFVAGWDQGDPGSLLDAARTALAEARDHPDRVSEGGGAAGEIHEDRTSRVVRAFEEAIEVRDPALGAHSRAVSRISRIIGSRMALPDRQIETLVVGGLLHDLGKIGIPDSVLNKPAALTAEEYEIVKQHPVLGARILEVIPELSFVLPAVRHHHERFDGRGYPGGLRGADVPLLARIILVADAFDSMTRDRVYRSGQDRNCALDEMTRNSGTQFDPEIVEILREIVSEPGGRRASL